MNDPRHFAHIGERLRSRRQNAHLSTEEVARAAGISRALLYRYESGDVVKLEVLEKLARLYETSTGALLGLGNEYITHGMLFFGKRSINHALALDAGVDTRSAAYAAPSSMFQGSSAS